MFIVENSIGYVFVVVIVSININVMSPTQLFTNVDLFIAFKNMCYDIMQIISTKITTKKNSDIFF